MMTTIGMRLWRAGRFEPRALPLYHKALRDEGALRALLMRSSVDDLEPLFVSILNGDTITVEGRVSPRGLKLLQRLGVPIELPDAPEPREQVRFIDMTPMLMIGAALVMAMRYLALGMHDRELYVMAGIGYAAFILIRTFSYQLKRPRNALPPTL